MRENKKERKRFFKRKLKDVACSTRITTMSNEKVQPIVLDDMVDEFIKWYSENMVKGQYTSIGEYDEPKRMRNFIEKMAVWYELRYPDYEVNRIMPGSDQEKKHISDVMFTKNPYISEVFDENSDFSLLDWNDFYNTKAFINSLPNDEKFYMDRPKYSTYVFYDIGYSSDNFKLSSKGIVVNDQFRRVKDEYLFLSQSGSEIILKNSEIEGKHIKEVLKIIKEKGIVFSENDQIEAAILEYDNRVYQKKEMLNCVMYRIIERGDNRIGPRRAFLFAKEFGTNIDIPMMYGVDSSDPGLRKFVNEYIKAGGSKDLVCYEGYFARASKYQPLKTISVGEIVRTRGNDAFGFYTAEEKALHQKLVNTLAKMSTKIE